MKITRQQVWDMFDSGWCPRCAEVTIKTPINTHMPGIVAHSCNKCSGHFTSNFLEEPDDILECPNHFVFKQNIKQVKQEE